MARFILSTYYGNPKSFDHLIPHQGMAMLAASLEEAGHEVSVIDANLRGGSPEDIVRRVRRERPDVLGLGLYQNGFQDSVEIARQVKAASPTTRVVAGGPHPTTWEENIYQFTDCSPIDLMCRGEGERVICDIARWAEGEIGKDDIPGVMFQHGGEIVKTPRVFLEDLNALPMPAWHHFDLERYLPILTIELGRSCPWGRCSFCVHTMIDGKRREKDMPAILREFTTNAERYGVPYARITDSMPTPRLLQNLTEAMISSRLPDTHGVRWTAFGNALILNDAVAEKMAQAGCIAVFLGIESGDDEMLKRMQKGVRSEHNRRAILAARRAGIKVAASNIIGFPGETEESTQRTIDLMLATQPDVVIMYPLGVLPSTDLATHPEKYGITLHPDWRDKFINLRYVLVDSKLDMLHYFDYADGKPNTW
ncbi:MAG TPA: radical SAM protein, partial [Candidatus Xenobia bacterium]